MIIALTGFMGSGKSSIGRKLSELLCCRFMDLDDVIESREERTIPEIFAEEGEAGFRAMELEALKMVINEYSCSTDEDEKNGRMLVLALGGGTVMTPECAALIHEYTYCIYLRATVETLVRNLEGEAAGRPMLQSHSGGADRNSMETDPTDSEALRARICELMAVRASVYESVAHQIIDTDGKTIERIASLCTPVGK